MTTQLGTLGPYFAAGAHDPRVAPAEPWHSMGDLLEDPEITVRRVDAVRDYLASANRVPAADVELRVAASVSHLGLAARTLSPFFALSVLRPVGQPIAPLRLRDLRWQPSNGSVFELSIPTTGDPAHVARSRAAAGAWIEPLATELCEVMRPYGVSPRVLWGNIASALNGARVAMSYAQPDLAARAAAECTRLLALPLLAGTSRVAPDGRFQRRSCCLIYRAAADFKGALCGDCVRLRFLED